MLQLAVSLHDHFVLIYENMKMQITGYIDSGLILLQKVSATEFW